jgi:general secretion pathway protein A
MYEAFYGLTEKPFGGTPDPRFLYLSPGHREALAHLAYGVQERKGFLVLTGEVGTGKTTMLNALRQRLHHSTAVATVANPFLSFDEMLEGMLADFGGQAVSASRLHRLKALEALLARRTAAGCTSVLVVDEAHDLDAQCLEQIRLLSNFETPQEKSLQILLVGQPELAEMLERPALRQLRQRVALRYAIVPLSVAETGAYIVSRLRRAGARDARVFTLDAVSLIAAHAGGIPRLINRVCDLCLVTAFGMDRRTVDEDIAACVVEQLEQGAPQRAAPRRRSRLAGAARRLRRLVLGRDEFSKESLRHE